MTDSEVRPKSGMTDSEVRPKSGMTDSEVRPKSGMTDEGVYAFSQDFGDARWLRNNGIACEFGLLPEALPLPATVILFLPREKDRLEFLLHFIAANLPSNGQLWLAGENKAGIKSAEVRLQQRFAKVKKVDSARHCVLYQAQQAKNWDSSSATVASDVGASHARDQQQGRALPETNQTKDQQTREFKTFTPADYLQEWILPTTAGEIRLQSLPGAFAHGRLDNGTALLLEYLQNAESRQLKIKGKILDFGCGVGVIGIYLKRQYPDIELEMLDTSATALESARLSLLLNGNEAKLTASDGLDKAHDRYDWIISNPPFHKGVATDLDITRRFIASAPAKLGNRGRMLLVCNRHLPYESWLAEAFAGFEKVAENREFKVLQAHGPRKVR